MGSACQCNNRLDRVGYKKFLARNANVFATVSRVDVVNMALKPSTVAIELLSLALSLRQFPRIGDLIHDNR